MVKMMFRRSIILLISLSLILTACSPNLNPTTNPTVTEVPATLAIPTGTAITGAPVKPITMVDGLGREIELPGPAQRIISLTPATTEILFAIGAGTQVVGRDTFSDYPAEAGSVTDIGGSMGKYNTEAMVNLQPDLIVAGGINPPELVASLESLGLQVFFLANPTTLDELYTSIKTVGDLTGNESGAADVVAKMESKVKEIDTRLTGITERPMLYYELDATPFTAGPGTFVDLLITRAGGTNFGANMDSAWAQISLEQLLLADPAFIILGDSAYGETVATVTARPGWNALTAVKDLKIFPFDDNLVSRPGPRLVDGLEALAHLIHPEAFK